MREIKFRGWDNELKIMVYNNELCGGINYDCNPVRALNIMLNEDDHGFEYMQYTGLKDKNCIEIYERDIVEFDDYYGSCDTGFVGCRNRGVVDYDPETISFFFTNRDSVEMHEIDFDELVVLGNIYENNELPEGTE
ncbi:MAG: YopX family protein [Solibacillus sp.]